mmetsp:Transcript_18062/g.46863  ORF Transcript_18062/g.46863 Transcript_18062/m.46863 type:complete len:229 (+) Transcript_18062:228-914(+)
MARPIQTLLQKPIFACKKERMGLSNSVRVAGRHHVCQTSYPKMGTQTATHCVCADVTCADFGEATKNGSIGDNSLSPSLRGEGDSVEGVRHPLEVCFAACIIRSSCGTSPRKESASMVKAFHIQTMRWPSGKTQARRIEARLLLRSSTASPHCQMPLSSARRILKWMSGCEALINVAASSPEGALAERTRTKLPMLSTQQPTRPSTETFLSSKLSSATQAAASEASAS